ncbi:hypoxanthine phosphoribosyltransferase [Alkalicoccus chagannorensis]|uniref:hypoxanthine phosphoribosyltransferase n=1 Tax=Alkalicoccus chagannorensis TaxID=427072 RepID=UPI00047A9684|nr:hypoxanthine phosphoribosyltransferase [Alkalicoccus chagannorensis]
METWNTEVMIDEQKIAARVQELAAEIEADAAGRPVVLIAVLKGSFVFAADLMRAMKTSVEIDFIAVSSYGNQTETTGKVRLLKDLDHDITDKYAVIVEDIVDSGLTLDFLVDHFRLHHPAELKICSLLNKPERRRIETPIDYIGFDIPDTFIVGYGIDYAQQYRNLPYIGRIV